MIELTRLNGSPLAINCDLIKYAEAAPDTVLTLITGEKLVVLEPCTEVSQRTLDYRAAVLGRRGPRPHPRSAQDLPSTPISAFVHHAAQRLRRITNVTLEEESLMDIASIGGIALAIIGILAGMMIEGGSIAQITQPTAAMIVFGGTLGAVMLQFPLSIFLAALKAIFKVFLHKSSNGEATLAQIVSFANKARRSGIVSLDADLSSISDPFLRQALMLAVDGTEPSEVRKIMQLELDNKSEIEEKIPAVFEAAGGYSPTVGIIGAVLGLIQVMKNLSNIDEVGRGIAVAFVATIYGVAMANLICLPAAGKLKFRHREEQMIKEMMLEGVISILEGMNPRMIETKLRTYLFDSEPANSDQPLGGQSMSKKKHPEHVNHERWLVSYADFITLLFAFFVVLFASSQSDKKKQMKLAEAMQSAFTPLGTFDAHSKTPPLTDTAPQQSPTRLPQLSLHRFPPPAQRRSKRPKRASPDFSPSRSPPAAFLPAA